jgi:hypothetical protein
MFNLTYADKPVVPFSCKTSLPGDLLYPIISVLLPTCGELPIPPLSNVHCDGWQRHRRI